MYWVALIIVSLIVSATIIICVFIEHTEYALQDLLKSKSELNKAKAELTRQRTRILTTKHYHQWHNS